MARNRQRAKQRKARQRAQGQAAQGGQPADAAAAAGEGTDAKPDAEIEQRAKPEMTKAQAKPKAKPAKSTAPAKQKADSAPRERGRLTGFFRSVWAELKRVQWPDRRQISTLTSVVIGFVILAGAYLGLIDAIAKKVVDLVIF